MTKALKNYTKASKIIVYKGEDLLTPLSGEELSKLLNNDQKFLNFGWRNVNKSNIADTDDAFISEIDMFILKQDKYTKNKLKERERSKKEKVWKGFESIKEVQNFILKNIFTWKH